jgi:hypothetical protein
MKVYVKMLMAMIAFVVAGLVCGTGHAANEPVKAVSSDYVQAFYFHATYRCKTCTTIEQYSRETIETNFKEQLDKGTLRFAEVNFDEPENRHYLQDYNLTYRSLVLVRYKNGKQVIFKNLEKIWQLKGNKADFSNYVKTEVEAFLKEL